MSFIDVQIQLQQTNALLARIADALDRAVPPIYPFSPSHRRGLESLTLYGDPLKQWKKENITNLVHSQGLAPAQEQELIDQALSESGDNQD